MAELHIDFESRSTIDLPKQGLDVYSAHPTTDLWCMGWAFDDDPVELWAMDDMAPVDVLLAVSEGIRVVAHNAMFEFVMWHRICHQRFGWPALSFEQTRCTMAMAYAMGLPGKLEKACPALGLDIEKDMKGHRLMLQMGRPRDVKPDGTIVWWDDDNRRARLHDYCKADVEAERALEKRLRKLPASEEYVRQMDGVINLRGVQVDVDAATAMRSAVEQSKEKLDKQMERATEGMVKQTTWTQVLTDWVRFQGVECNGVAKDEVARMLADDDVPEHVKTALRIRQQAAKTSTAKIDKMLGMRGADDRVRGMFQYHGAATGRWAGRGIQLHNLPRGYLKPDQADDAIEMFLAGRADELELIYGDVMDVASSCIRGLFVAKDGHTFQAADFSNIEGRVLAWLAGEKGKLQAFRDADAGRGPEIYKITAGGIIGKGPDAVTDDERQVFGKVPELALGFGGGAGAFGSMAVVYGVDMADHYGTVRNTVSEHVLERAIEAWDQWGRKMGMSRSAWIASEAIKIAWRQKHPAIEQFWKDLEEAALNAVREPGNAFTAGPKRIVFKVDGSFLWCKLPSGRLLCYPYPEIREKKTPWGSTSATLTYMEENEKRQWVRTDSYGGKLAENCLAEGTLVLCERGWVPVEKVKLSDRVWDGQEWARHEGLTKPIRKPTLRLDGIRMTADHEIFTKNGWAPALANPRPYRPEIRSVDRAWGFAHRWAQAALAVCLRVRNGVRQVRQRRDQGSEARRAAELRLLNAPSDWGEEPFAWHDQASSLRGVEKHAGSLPAAFTSSVAQLRRAGYSRVRAVAIVCQVLAGHECVVLCGLDTGPDRQRRRLHAEQLPVGQSAGSSEQQAGLPLHRNPVGEVDRRAGITTLRDRAHDAFVSARSWLAARSPFRQTRPQEQVVYDLKNAGPRHCFTVMGSRGPVLVHNCTQAAAADNLRFAMANSEQAGWPIVLHVHDELVAEVPKGTKRLADLERTMEKLPRWAAGLPLKVQGWEARRFRKD